MQLTFIKIRPVLNELPVRGFRERITSMERDVAEKLKSLMTRELRLLLDRLREN